MSDVIVLFSGGIDSTVLAKMAHNQGRLSAVIFINYRQPAHVEENRTAREWARAHDVKMVHVAASIHGVDEAMKTGQGAPGPRILPGRNLVFVAHAVNCAASMGAREVWYGAAADDHEYPDCLPKWVESVDAIAHNDVGLRVRAPLINMTKDQVFRLAEAEGVDLTKTWSCYQPIRDPARWGRQCGECNSCREAVPSWGDE